VEQNEPPDPRTDKQPPPRPPVTLEDFEPFAECDRRLTDEQVEAIKNMAYFRLVLLARQLGSDFTPEVEAAFLNGAMSAFFACKSQDRLPSSWVFGSRRMLDVLAQWKAEGSLHKGPTRPAAAEGGQT
jgi:hypothetical protein